MGYLGYYSICPERRSYAFGILTNSLPLLIMLYHYMIVTPRIYSEYLCATADLKHERLQPRRKGVQREA